MKDDMRALRRENKRLRRKIKKLRGENEYLSHRVDVLSGTKSGGAEANMRKISRMGNSSGYFAYMLLKFKSTAAYAIYDKTSFVFRKYIFASNFLKTARYAFLLFRGSVVFIVAAGIFLSVLPVLALTALAAFLASLVLSGKWNSFFAEYLRDKKIYVYFHIRRDRSEKYYHDTLENLGEDAVIFVICDSVFAAKNVCASRYDDNIFYIYTGYYYRLKKYLRRRGISGIHIY